MWPPHALTVVADSEVVAFSVIVRAAVVMSNPVAKVGLWFVEGGILVVSAVSIVVDEYTSCSCTWWTSSIPGIVSVVSAAVVPRIAAV